MAKLLLTHCRLASLESLVSGWSALCGAQSPRLRRRNGVSPFLSQAPAAFLTVHCRRCMTDIFTFAGQGINCVPDLCIGLS